MESTSPESVPTLQDLCLPKAYPLILKKDFENILEKQNSTLTQRLLISYQELIPALYKKKISEFTGEQQLELLKHWRGWVNYNDQKVNTFFEDKEVDIDTKISLLAHWAKKNHEISPYALTTLATKLLEHPDLKTHQRSAVDSLMPYIEIYPTKIYEAVTISRQDRIRPEDENIVKHHLQYGANPNSALDMSIVNQKRQLFEFILNHTRDQEAINNELISQALRTSNEFFIERLTKKFPTINIRVMNIYADILENNISIPVSIDKYIATLNPIYYAQIHKKRAETLKELSENPSWEKLKMLQTIPLNEGLKKTIFSETLKKFLDPNQPEHMDEKYKILYGLMRHGAIVTAEDRTTLLESIKLVQTANAAHILIPYFKQQQLFDSIKAEYDIILTIQQQLLKEEKDTIIDLTQLEKSIISRSKYFGIYNKPQNYSFSNQGEIWDTIKIKTYFPETDYVCSMIGKISDLSPKFIGAMSKEDIYYYKNQLITAQGHFLLNYPKPHGDDTSDIDNLTIGSERFNKVSGLLDITPIEELIENNVWCSYAINRSTLNTLPWVGPIVIPLLLGVTVLSK
jgi:hypothetical protein